MTLIFPSEFPLTTLSESTEEEEALVNGDCLNCAFTPQAWLLNTRKQQGQGSILPQACQFPQFLSHRTFQHSQPPA